MRRSLLERLTVATCRALLRLHPAPCREHYEDDMVVALRDAMRDAGAHGRSSAFSRAAAEILDVARSGIAARRGVRITAASFHSAPSGGSDVFPTWIEWRHALRRLVAHPGYSALVIAALALGVGANTIVFSVADTVLFRGVPYPNGARIVELFHQPANSKTFSPGLLLQSLPAWQKQPDLFTQVEGFNYATFVVTSGGEPESMAAASVTPGLFPALGVRPAIGRLFDPGEDQRGRNHVVILSHRLWQRDFGGNPQVIGREMTLDGTPHTVVGVMPRGFRFPAAPQLFWIPATPPEGARNPRLQAVALLAPGVTAQMAQQRSDTIADGLQETQPLPTGWRLRVMTLRGMTLGTSTRQAVQILLVAVAIVLLIACANVANLFLAQAMGRDRELSIRAALGAGRWRLVRELLAEGMVLAGLGGLVGVAMAWWGVDAVLTLAPDRLTRFHPSEIRLDGRVLFFTASITVATGLLFAIVPALRASRPALTPALAGRTTSAGRSHGRVRGALVIVEVALSVVLLVGAALLIKSFIRLQAVDIGYDARDLLQMSISLPAARYPEAQRVAFFRNLQEAVSTMPGVRAVTTGDGLPGDANLHFAEVEVEGRRPDGKSLIIPGSAAAPDYFAVMGIPIVRGRAFTADDTLDSIIVSQSMASALWPGEDPIGKRMRLGERDTWKTVVGVAGEIRQEHRIAHIAQFEIYTPYWPRTEAPVSPQPRTPVSPSARVSGTLFVRAEDPLALVPLIKQAVWRVEPGQPIAAGVLAEHSLAKGFSDQRFALSLMTSFAAVALLLAVAGLYAVLSHLVVQRTQEIGVRLALGAQRLDIWQLIVGRGMALTTVGVAAGLGAAYGLSKYVRSQLYETSATDVATFVTVGTLMLVVSLVACWMPTRYALRVDPIAALRNE